MITVKVDKIAPALEAPAIPVANITPAIDE